MTLQINVPESAKKTLPKMSRSRWVWILVIANAVSMSMMYAMQGILVAGIEHGTLPAWFWYADIAGWMVRALVESLVVLYLFRTNTTNNWYKLTLTFFEVVLIALIMVTQGPTLYAMTVRLPVSQTMSVSMLRLWTGGLGAYGALMLAATGVAYRIQPDDEELYTQTGIEDLLAIQYEQYEFDKSVLEEDLKNQPKATQEQVEKAKEFDILRDVLENADWQTVEGLAATAGYFSDVKPGQFAKAVNSKVPEIRDALSKGAELRRKGES